MTFTPKNLLRAIVVTTLTTSALTLTPVQAQEATAELKKLGVGSTAPALEGITWIQGEPIKSLDEKGKVYMLELWATWCGPCIQIIPHVNDWHQKYQSKGLEIVGMNVFEDKIDTVKEFVKSQGDNMSYRVAFSGGKGSKFETNWLIPAGIQSIPHALLIKDGKIIFKGHPGSLNDSTIESMLSDDFDAEKFAQEAAGKEAAQNALREKLAPLFQSKDWDGIIEVAESLEDSDPTKVQLMLTAVIQKADWKKLSELRATTSDNAESPIDASAIDKEAALNMPAGDGSKEYATLALKKMPAIEGQTEQQIPATIAKARLQFLSGDSASAKQTIAQTKELAEKVSNQQFKTQIDQILPAIEKSLAEDKFPSLQELLQGQ
ncbi:TlpA family protein disulfide reductase [Rubritalea spongiae]|uniref:TlpA family protein disulfide reductase n=1 Tax=Rubritalea spongiae TaxID=430797 RepID=A0ABW5E525_9BACT